MRKSELRSFIWRAEADALLTAREACFGLRRRFNHPHGDGPTKQQQSRMCLARSNTGRFQKTTLQIVCRSGQGETCGRASPPWSQNGSSGLGRWVRAEVRVFALQSSFLQRRFTLMPCLLWQVGARGLTPTGSALSQMAFLGNSIWNVDAFRVRADQKSPTSDRRDGR
jgi:hypothetical protein